MVQAAKRSSRVQNLPIQVMHPVTNSFISHTSEEVDCFICLIIRKIALILYAVGSSE